MRSNHASKLKPVQRFFYFLKITKMGMPRPPGVLKTRNYLRSRIYCKKRFEINLNFDKKYMDISKKFGLCINSVSFFSLLMTLYHETFSAFISVYFIVRMHC